MANKPIRIFWSSRSKRFYASNQYTIKGGVAIITGRKYDVTDDIAVHVIKHDIVFTERNEDGK